MGMNIIDSAFQHMYGLLTGQFNGSSVLNEFNKTGPSPGPAASPVPNEGIVKQYQDNVGINAADDAWNSFHGGGGPSVPKR
jgi:hypothetical protein